MNMWREITALASMKLNGVTAEGGHRGPDQSNRSETLLDETAPYKRGDQSKNGSVVANMIDGVQGGAERTRCVWTVRVSILINTQSLLNSVYRTFS